MPKVPCPIPSNFIPPAQLAQELGIEINVVTNWIRRDLIDYMELPGQLRHRYLVDRTKVPATSPNNAGRPRK